MQGRILIKMSSLDWWIRGDILCSKMPLRIIVLYTFVSVGSSVSCESVMLAALDLGITASYPRRFLSREYLDGEVVRCCY